MKGRPAFRARPDDHGGGDGPAGHAGGVAREAALRPRHLVGAGDRRQGLAARHRHRGRPHPPARGRRGQAGGLAAAPVPERRPAGRALRPDARTRGAGRHDGGRRHGRRGRHGGALRAPDGGARRQAPARRPRRRASSASCPARTCCARCWSRPGRSARRRGSATSASATRCGRRCASNPGRRASTPSPTSRTAW